MLGQDFIAEARVAEQQVSGSHSFCDLLLSDGSALGGCLANRKLPIAL